MEVKTVLVSRLGWGKNYEVLLEKHIFLWYSPETTPQYPF
jgi:hypothetical protein